MIENTASEFNILEDLNVGEFPFPSTAVPGPASPIAACYARFSSDLQSSDSVDQQVRACREIAQRNGHEIRDELIFDDMAVSGTKLKREGLQRMVQAAAQRRFSVLYLYSLSRLARETSIAVPLVKYLVHRCGVRLIAVAEGIDSQQAGWEMGLQILSLVHEQFIRDLSGHVRRGHEAAQRRGHSTGDICFGYRSAPVPGYASSVGTRAQRTPKICVINEITSPWVKRIFDWFTQNELSLQGITRELNRLSAPKDHRSTSTTWYPGSVRSILANEKYIGQWHWGKSRIRRDPLTGRTFREFRSPEEQQEWRRERPELRLISDEQFQAAQQRLRQISLTLPRRKRGQLAGARTVADGRPARQLLSCLIKCGHCGSPFYVTGSGSRYLGCARQLTGTCVCKAKLQRRRAERLILAEIGRWILQNEAWRQAVVQATQSAWQTIQEQRTPRRGELERRRQSLQQKIDRLVDSVERGESPPELRHRLEERRAEITRIDGELRELDHAVAWSPEAPSTEWIMNRLEHLHEVLTNPSPAAASALRKLVGGAIVVEQVALPDKKRRYLRGKFTLDVPNVVASLVPTEFAARVSDHLPQQIVIDFRDEDPDLELAWELYESGKLVKQIAAELNITSVRARKLLQKAAARLERPLEDGRARQGRLKQELNGHRKHELIADEVMQLWERGLLLTEIAQRLSVHRDMITAAIRYWHQSRGLPVPDGRTRRKSLERKSISLDGQDGLVAKSDCHSGPSGLLETALTPDRT